jgi:hypothetical protein
MALPKPAAKIWIDCDKKKVMLSAPFNDNFNRFIHHLPRHFDKENKVWEFELEFVDQVIDIAYRCWNNVLRPPFLLIEIFEHLTEDDLKEMYENLSRRHRSDQDKTLLTLLNKFFEDYIDLTEILRKKKRLIRLERVERGGPVELHETPNVVDLSDLFRDIQTPGRIELREVEGTGGGGGGAQTSSLRARTRVEYNEAVEDDEESR